MKSRDDGRIPQSAVAPVISIFFPSFSAPVKEGVNGILVSKGRFQYGSKGIIEDLRFEFKKGKVVKYSARKGKKALETIMKADDRHGQGVKYLGEIGLGTNPHLRRHVVNGLLVEKIGGSFHVALGSCYTFKEYLGTPVKIDNGNVSFSSTHWDVTTMLRGKAGKMYLDGELIQEDGDWIGKEFRVLNEGWGAVDKKMRPSWWVKKS